ncbi:protein tyrosine phosphatase [Phyllobacterium phragmitis]|uniref:Protein tyrosine phosphatase n=2 Tax=Phyllobacterium phragmitis TaxID=2670329 RepID=A0A2S9IP55_9HYPH|nr:protein tyrosine phosphatase [Phyllobacterium phragmitis]
MVGGYNVRFTNKLKLASRTTVGLICALGLYLANLQLSGNFHVISTGEAYRSAQPTPARIDAYSKQFGIKTIINLRGASQNASWYKAETSEAAKLGITHIDFKMSAGKQLSQAEASQIISILENAPKPLLIHCKAGADRSGLISALYLAAVKKAGEAAAESQISIRYGHFSLPFVSTYAMDRTFEFLEPSLGFSDS